MENLQKLMELLQNYNQIFSDNIQYVYEIGKVEKKLETESELIDRVLNIDKAKGEMHNGSLLKINEWEKLLTYVIQNWSMDSFLDKITLSKSDASIFRDMKDARMKEKPGWRFGEPNDDEVVDNPISKTFKEAFLQTFEASPICAYQIDSDPNYFYGVYWEDYLFEFDSFYIYLSFCLLD